MNQQISWRNIIDDDDINIIGVILLSDIHGLLCGKPNETPNVMVSSDCANAVLSRNIWHIKIANETT